MPRRRAAMRSTFRSRKRSPILSRRRRRALREQVCRRRRRIDSTAGADARAYRPGPTRFERLSRIGDRIGNSSVSRGRERIRRCASLLSFNKFRLPHTSCPVKLSQTAKRTAEDGQNLPVSSLRPPPRVGSRPRSWKLLASHTGPPATTPPRATNAPDEQQQMANDGENSVAEFST